MSKVDIKPDDRNLNKGTPRGVALLEKSLERYGAGRSILVDKDGRIIAGNKTWQEAVEKGFEVEVVKTDGKKLVAVQRVDLSLDSAEGRGLALADNRVAEIDLAWDAEELQAMAEEIDLSEWFMQDELNKLLSEAAEEKPTHPLDKGKEEWSVLLQFGDEEAFTAFRNDVMALAKAYGTETAADTVARAVRNAVKPDADGL